MKNDQIKIDKSARDIGLTSVKKPYVAPAIINEEKLEAVAVSCPLTSMGGAGKNVNPAFPTTTCSTLGS